MEFSKRFSLSMLCLLFIIVLIFGFGVINREYLVNSVRLFNNKDSVDISGIAYGITDRIDDKSIIGVAANIERVEVFDGLTKNELVNKLNRYLNNKGVLANQGELIATRCLELGINPYLAIAIMMHETGCNAKCSNLAKNYNNVGGMRGRSGWQKFSSLEAGINGFLNNLYKNYYKYGLNTPEKMYKKYAEGSTSWPTKVNNYIEKIEAA